MRPEFDVYADIVASVLSITHRLDGSIEQFKAVVQLVDGSRLHINEVYIDGDLRKYAYYRLTPSGKVLQGWDNAPHHPEVASYPNHCHCGDSIRASDVRTLHAVLETLSELLRV